jgi:hypothetical protein
MNRKSVGSLLFVVLIVLLCLVAACTTDQFTQKESKTKGPLTAEERARQAEEARVLESMWYEGSAYHRGRDDSGAVDVGKWMRNRKEMKAQQEETEKRLAKLEKKAEKQQPAEAQVQGVGSESTAAVAAPVAAANKGAKSQQPLRFKVAIVFMPETYGSGTEPKTILVAGVRQQFAGHPWFLLVEPEEIEEVLAQQGLSVRQENKAKIARTLGVYPAARLVLFLDKVTTLWWMAFRVELSVETRGSSQQTKVLPKRKNCCERSWPKQLWTWKREQPSMGGPPGWPWWRARISI